MRRQNGRKRLWLGMWGFYEHWMGSHDHIQMFWESDHVGFDINRFNDAARDFWQAVQKERERHADPNFNIAEVYARQHAKEMEKQGLCLCLLPLESGGYDMIIVPAISV